MRFNSITFLLIILLTSCAAIHLTPSRKVYPITFNSEPEIEGISFVYPDTAGDLYMRQLRNDYHLEGLLAGAESEEQKVLLLMDWTHRQWKHNGSNEPSQSDALTILKEAREGRNFRCVEFGIVLKSALLACGIKARTLGLKTRDVERTRLGAGHVATEVWLADRQKWALVDAQFNAMPVLEGIPLNAAEFQQAFVQKKAFEIVNLHGNLSKKEVGSYLRFIPHYLYYFDVRFDQRMVPYADALKVNEKGFLMLVPVGAKEPAVFQRKFELDYMIYTHSLADFYRNPV